MKKSNFLLIIPIGILLIVFLAVSANAATYSISGRVFEDKNCNGQQNAGDVGIAGVTMTLTPGSLTTSTAANGNYSFSGLSNGTYVVKETDPSAYCSTTPNKKTIKISGKNVTNQNFGDSKLPASPGGETCCADE